jgi:hypothetical protein
VNSKQINNTVIWGAFMIAISSVNAYPLLSQFAQWIFGALILVCIFIAVVGLVAYPLIKQAINQGDIKNDFFKNAINPSHVTISIIQLVITLIVVDWVGNYFLLTICVLNFIVTWSAMIVYSRLTQSKT